MRLWTLQRLEVWQRLQELEELRVEPERFPNQYVPERYEWLREQLRLRCPPWQGLPWWAYCRRPDLRRHRWSIHQRLEVLLELEKPDNEVVTFPHWAWHEIYCGNYLGHEQRPAVDLDIWPWPEPWRSKLEASWGGLFAPGLEDHGEREAVFEVLRLSEVVRCRIFQTVRWKRLVL
jgi:hypothetical protein